MIELIRRVCEVEPSRPAVVTHEGTATYGDLLADAQSNARALLDASVDRFGVDEVDAARVIAAMAAASMVGAEACIYPPVEIAETRQLLERFDHHVCLTSNREVEAHATPLTPSASDRPVDTALPRSRPHLVLTTGTTGTPRGVRHDWQRLVRGVQRVGSAPADRWLLAFGIHQFAGLQILLHVLAAGSTLVAPAPRRPLEGLRAIRELGVTHASATPTYWRFLLAEMQSDGRGCPPLRQITLGGEAIPGPLLKNLEHTFPDAHISQVYAASEFGSSGSVRDGRSGLPTSVLDRGDEADVDMRIVDGELWVRSRTGMLGYHDEEPIDPDGWRPTGDLVEIVADRVVFCGRTSDVINVGGVKVHPLPVEERVAAVPGVALSRVFGRPNPVMGSILAVEIVPLSGYAESELKDAIRQSCADLVPAARPRSIKFVDSIQTVGHKVVRRPL